ncbi:hypothetical protein HDV06_002350 [Boothiomyces sp. JEL0866]|nr:hypothetical protein HDV06_002350 [Boothiomyces sp. JEL0866]
MQDIRKSLSNVGKIKVNVVGDRRVGKSTLLANKIKFFDTTELPINIQVGQRTAVLKHRDFNLWEEDENGKETLYSISEKWLTEALQYAPGVPIVLVGMKLDLRDGDSVTKEQGEETAKLIGAYSYVECSAVKP